jgi:hypothetical protein
MWVVGIEQWGIMSVDFFEKYELFAVIASGYQMGVIATGLVVNACPSLAHDHIGETGMENPTVRAMS